MARAHIGLACGLLLALTACQAPVTYGPKATAEELAREEARQQQMVDKAASQGGAPRPWRKRSGITSQFNRVADRIDQAGAKLCQEMGLPRQGKRCYYYFRLALDRELNSHADGENIVIYSGMLHFLKDDDEVAVLIAHELAHNLMGHVDAAQNNAAVGAVVGALVDGALASQGVATRGEWMGTGARMGATSYSIGFEEEADYVGLYIAARAGYDIRKAPEMWRRMTLENPESMLRETTHPSNARRAATIQKTIEEIAFKRQRRIPLLPDFKQAVTNEG